MSTPESTHDVAEATQKRETSQSVPEESGKAVDAGSDPTGAAADGQAKQLQPDGR